jgi:hypothetical protein
MNRGEVNQDPVQEEFFTSREDRAEGLVREAVQNSLDAATNGKVRVRFAFSEAPLDPDAANRYTPSIGKHLKASLGDQVVVGEMDFIAIEDFGTRGLGGDPAQDHDDPGHSKKNDFYYFWRNVGRSSKSDTDRGRWGVGKIVYPASSRMNAFFGYTVRAEDGRHLLMGQAVLKVHELADGRYCPYPYFGVADGDFALPVEDKDFISQFRSDFGLQRTTEPGLSIVIPHARHDEITADDVLKAAIRNYFYPILAGTLTLEVKSRTGLVTLASDTLRAAAGALTWANGQKEQLERLFDLAAWAIGLPGDRHIDLAEPGPGASVWTENLLAEELAPALRDRFEAGERLAFRIGVKVHKKGAVPLVARYRAILVKDQAVSRGEEQYIRQGITIADIRKIRDVQVRGLVVVEDPALSALLGDSEGPAHADWSEREGKLKDRYVHGASCVRFVKNTLRQLVAFLSRPPAGLNRDLLADLFYVERESDVPGPLPGPQPKPGKKPEETDPPPPPPPPPPSPPNLKLTRIEGGFRVTGRPGLRGGVTVRAAYQIRGGNPFRAYDRNDFDLGKKQISVEGTGVRDISAKENQLEFVVDAEEFELKVTGFDPNRDLAVRANLLEEVDSKGGEDAA